MVSKQISNPAQAYSLGATWGTPSVDNQMTTEIADLINNTGVVLYTGDIVTLDATGTLANLPTANADPTVIGTVGTWTNMSKYPTTAADYPTEAQYIQSGAADGNIQPQQITPAQTLTLGFTNGNDNITSALVSTNNPLQVGLLIYTPYNSSTNATPQVFQVASNGGTSGSWTAVGVVVSGAGTTFSGTTGSFVCSVVDAPGSNGPGWAPSQGWTSSSQYSPGEIVPVTFRGFGRVNISALTTVVAGSELGGTASSAVGLLLPGNGNVGATVTAPTFPATTVAVTNTSGFGVMAVINEPSVTYTVVKVNGVTLAGETSAINGSVPITVWIPAGGTFSQTYSAGTPTWVWIASSTAGSGIAVALEAYAARDVLLTNAGITGHDSVRAIIGKF